MSRASVFPLAGCAPAASSDTSPRSRGALPATKPRPAVSRTSLGLPVSSPSEAKAGNLPSSPSQVVPLTCAPEKGSPRRLHTPVRSAQSRLGGCPAGPPLLRGSGALAGNQPGPLGLGLAAAVTLKCRDVKCTLQGWLSCPQCQAPPRPPHHLPGVHTLLSPWYSDEAPAAICAPLGLLVTLPVTNTDPAPSPGTAVSQVLELQGPEELQKQEALFWGFDSSPGTAGTVPTNSVAMSCSLSNLEGRVQIQGADGVPS